jgi:hypothetical protein
VARLMPKADVITLAHLNFPSFLRSRDQALLLDKWGKGNQDDPVFIPSAQETSDEYDDLAARAPTPWISLIITSLVQTCFLEGINLPGENKPLDAWRLWQENGWDAKQISLYRSVFTQGAAYGLALPAKNPMTGSSTVKFRAIPASKMSAFYTEEDDEFPMFAIEAERIPDNDRKEIGWTVRVYDDLAVHYLTCKADGAELSDWTYLEPREHTVGVTPISGYFNQVDLEGHVTSETQPLIPLAKRVDQDTFDRLIVQRFGAWKIRYIAGMAKPSGGLEAERAAALMLKVEDLLISTDAGTKFGTLDATDLAGFIAARDADLRDFSAVGQVPPHHMLGLSSNLQAESLAAAEAGLGRKSLERKTGFGESHERLLRIGAHILGNRREAEAFDMQSRWRDMESRSLSQAADALGKLATQLHVPLEMLWERIPNWTDADSERAKNLVADGGVDALLAEVDLALKKQAAEDAAAAKPAPVAAKPAPAAGS